MLAKYSLFDFYSLFDLFGSDNLSRLDNEPLEDLMILLSTT